MPPDLPGRTPDIRNLVAREMAAANRALLRSRDKYVSGYLSYSYHNAQTDGVELPETASSTVEGEPASGSKTDVLAVNPKQAAEKTKLGSPLLAMGDGTHRQAREIAAGHCTQTFGSARDGEQPK